MLQQFLNRLEPVHRAETREEREAVYAFRYQVCAEQLGRELGSLDRARRWVTDADDEKVHTTVLYTGTVEAITGTVRLRHWRAGEVPAREVARLSMDRFSDIGKRNTAEIGELAVRWPVLDQVFVVSLLTASYEILAGEQQTDLTFCHCSPRLLRYYQLLAMRPFGGRPVDAAGEIMVPLVTVMSDLGYFVQMRTLLAPLVIRYFGRGKRPPLSLAPYRHLLTAGSGRELEPERVFREVTNAIEEARASGATLGPEPTASSPAPPHRLMRTLSQWWADLRAAGPTSGWKLLTGRLNP